MRGMISADLIANRFLLVGCAGTVTLIVTLLIAAMR